MLLTCKYCTEQEAICDRCNQKAILKGIQAELPIGEVVTKAFRICTNLECPSYGVFEEEHADQVEIITCQKCNTARSLTSTKQTAYAEINPSEATTKLDIIKD